ncbi:iron-sulfur cluster assembly scaffold protein [Fundidesulfovibrio soli]|uniref:iron-sulfur cluster assembly scaffold protein n=1 Tax=Fundidesulfovibrio soli TaxID=2922716 RepID=UPI001FAFE9C0|nr:iron-sulfur cluster assembly scaffold protein [Fundidesulfovibrio soli]
MNLTLTITGRRCDLALHPVSSKTVERIKELGRKFYTKKYIHWWRNGNTSTCGMKIDDECVIKVDLDGQPAAMDSTGIADSAVLLRRRHYLDSKARYLALLGYDDEYCHMNWTWKDVDSFDPARFHFFVHRWDRILGSTDFLILDDVRYNGRFADEQDWGGSCGFSLVDPTIIDLEAVRREVAVESVPELVMHTPEHVPASTSAAIMPMMPETPLTIAVEGANASGTYGCTSCSLPIRMDLRIKNGTVEAAGGSSEGCEYSKQCLTALSNLVEGKSVDECAYLTHEDLRKHLPKLPGSLYCDVFTVGALKIALRNWERKAA